jgi:pimeloyl-ACP methyl ester carboxylesterase
VPTLQRDDATLWYDERGPADGLPVVLLHGLLMSSRFQQRLAARLTGQRVFLLDQRGHGRSTSPRDAEAYDLRLLADDVLAFLDHEGLDRVVLGGMSLGANVTLEVALLAPERLAGIILEMPVFARGEAAGRAFFGACARLLRLGAPFLDLARPIVRRLPVPSGSPHELAYVKELAVADHRAVAALLRALLRESITLADPETLRRVQTPALVVAHGAGGRIGDPVHVLQDALDVAEFLPHSRVLRSYSVWDNRIRPDRFAAGAREFIVDAFAGNASRASGH